MELLTDEEKRQALLEALGARRQMQLGQVMQLAGGRTLPRLGQSLVEGGLERQRVGESARNRDLQIRLQAQRDEAEADYRRQNLDLQRQQLGQGRFTSQIGTDEQGKPVLVTLNTRTGKVERTDVGAPPKGIGGAMDRRLVEQQWKDFESGLKTTSGLSRDLQRSINSAEALEALLKLPNGQLANATPQQMHEAYTALNNLISKGGSQAASQVEALVPETLASKWANLKQTILNEPQGADAAAFIENILETSARESQLARKQLRRQQLQSIPRAAHLRNADQTRFESMLRGVGIDPASIDAQGLEVQAPADGAWSNDKEARLQELRRKRAARAAGGGGP